MESLIPKNQKKNDHEIYFKGISNSSIKFVVSNSQKKKKKSWNLFERNFQYPNLKNDHKRNCFKGISIPQLILGTPIPKNQNIIICYSFYKEANNGKNFVFAHLVSQQKR